MNVKPFRNVNYIGWVAIVLAFLLIYLYYFLIYIPDQKSDLTQRAFRILKEYEKNMAGKQAYYNSHFSNYGIYYSLKSFENDKKIIPVNPSLKDYQDIKEVFNDLFAYVEPGYVKNFTDNAFVYFEEQGKPYVYFKNQDTVDSSMQKIQVVYKINAQNNSIENLHDIFYKTSFYKFPIEKFMEGLKFDELFENISLFNQSKVLYNSNPDRLPDITNPQPLCDSTDVSQGGIYLKIKIRGKNKHLMVIPVEFKGQRLYLAGVINHLDFNKITRTFNSWVMILAAGILLLVFFGMPVLKTVFIGPHERLSPFDVTGSGISILIGSALFVLIIIGLIKHQFVDRQELSTRIEQISGTLQNNVTCDINSVKKLGIAIALKNTSKVATAGSAINAFQSKTAFHTKKQLKYPFPLNEIILVDTSGIVKKAYTRTAFSGTVEVNLSDRLYFKNMVKPDPGQNYSDSSSYFLESIKSYNTGKHETALSFHTTKYDKKNVLAITSEIPSLYYQVLPKDIEFVIINKSGHVLYHSNISKNLHENFIEECESNPNLLNAMQLGIKNNVYLKYNEKKWLARVAPIKDSPLFHITLLDLNQSDTKNARIILITFFLIVGLQIFTIVCIVLFILAFQYKDNETNFLRFLKWLSFLPSDYNSYKGMLIILLLIAAAGISSFVAQANIVNVLLLQVLSVGFTFLSTVLFLKRENLSTVNYFKLKYFPENLILIFLVGLIIFGLVKCNRGNENIIPLGILSAVVFIIPYVLNYFKRNKISADTDNLMPKAKSAYLAVLFLWLAIFSVIPVIHSYFSVKHFEEKLWQQQQLFKIATGNLELLKSLEYSNSEWFRRVQGNDIDQMTVTVIPVKNEELTPLNAKDNDELSNVSDKIYSWLYDPLKNGLTHRDFLKSKKQETNWKLNDNHLYYPDDANKRAVLVSAVKTPDKVSGYFIVLTIVFLLASVCVWLLVKFVAKVFLNLENDIKPPTDIEWINYLKNPGNQRILLTTFNGDLFLAESKLAFKNKNTEPKKIETIPAYHMLKTGFDWKSYLSGTSGILWIYGLHECIPEIENHTILIDVLMQFNIEHNKKIVIELPFELDLIDEYYNDFIESNQLSTKEIADIFKLRKRWRNVFADYLKYNGFISQSEFTETQNKLSAGIIKNYRRKQDTEWCYANIWKNLTNYEKIVLYDLADDGFMNRNNRKIISRLTDKKLIVFNPYPGLCSGEFRDYVTDHISRNEIKAIEKKQGLKGNWRNTKFFILMIIIPLAIFIFISQGLTIEKSFGIFAGIVGAITALIKLFESSAFTSK